MAISAVRNGCLSDISSSKVLYFPGLFQ